MSNGIHYNNKTKNNNNVAIIFKKIIDIFICFRYNYSTCAMVGTLNLY